MSALMIARITVKDPAAFQEYLQKSKQLAGSHGAELLFRGRVGRSLNGEQDHEMTVIARFPSLQKIEEWYDSADYQPLKALRDTGSDMHMTAYEVQD